MIELITAIVLAIAPGSTVTCHATPPPEVSKSALGWVIMERKEVYLVSRVCNGIGLDPRTVVTQEFALSLHVVLHEAWHSAGWRNEGCANLKAELVSYDILRRFWKIPFFSALSWQIGGQLHQLARHQAPEYFPYPWACD